MYIYISTHIHIYIFIHSRIHTYSIYIYVYVCANVSTGKAPVQVLYDSIVHKTHACTHLYVSLLTRCMDRIWVLLEFHPGMTREKWKSWARRAARSEDVTPASKSQASCYDVHAFVKIYRWSVRVPGARVDWRGLRSARLCRAWTLQCCVRPRWRHPGLYAN